jgi:hypothetical protein
MFIAHVNAHASLPLAALFGVARASLSSQLPRRQSVAFEIKSAFTLLGYRRRLFQSHQTKNRSLLQNRNRIAL